MSNITYRLRIRNAADSADALTVTSVPSGTNPYISQPPSGDGQGFNPRTGATEVGAYTVGVADNGSAANVITGFLSDGSGRYDKLGRRAFLEYSTDGGATWPNLLVAGYVTQISYPSAAEAQVTVGEAQRAERNRLAFSIADSTYPATTMLGGGPVRWPAGVVPPINWTDRGPWTMAVVNNDTVRSIVSLRFTSGYVLTDENATDYTMVRDGAFPIYMFRRLATLTASESLGDFVGASSPWARVGNLYADVYLSGALIGTFPFMRAGPGQYAIGTNGGIELAWTTAASPGALYQVYLYSLSVSESNPLHVIGHPLTIVTGLITSAGEQFDSTSAAAVISAIGADLRVFLRLTSAEATDSFIAKLMGLFGFGRRMNNANQWEFFLSRTKDGTLGTTITSTDLREIPRDLWVLDESTIINNVTVSTQIYGLWAPGQGGNRPPDSLVPIEQRRTARFQLADGSYADTTQGIKELNYDLSGQIFSVSANGFDLTDFVTGIAGPTFDRWGYGAPSTSLACLPNVTATVGDEIPIALPALPNGSARGGTRIVQIVQRTNEPGGPVLRVEDAGLSSQPSTAPTFTIAAGAVSPLTTADITLTNAAALAAAGITSVAVEFAVSAGSPASAGIDLGAITPSAPVVLTTPAAAAGSKVWARARSIQAGRRPSAWTAWASVTLTSVGAPSSLAFTAAGTDGSRGTVTWVAGANSGAFLVDVLLRLSALTSTADITQAQTGAGSTAAQLERLTPSTSYTVTVRYTDPTTGIVAASTSLTFTSGATTLTLSVPLNPAGIVGRTDVNGVTVCDGSYGLDVFAADIPGTVEVWEAIETSVASGTYGTATLKASVPSVNGGPTSWRNVAPNDRLRRSLTARHVRAGATSSSFTTAVVLNPWGSIIGPNVSGGYALSTPVALCVNGSPGTLTITFSNSGFPLGTTFDLAWSVDGGAAGTTANITSGVVISTTLTGSASGKVEISANYAGMILSQKKYWGVFPT